MQNKKGNAAVIALIVVIVAVTASAITWKFATKTQVPMANGVPETQLPQADTQTTVPTQNNTTQYFEVKEMGLKFPVDQMLATDVEYKISNEFDVQDKVSYTVATISSKKLESRGCSDFVSLLKVPGKPNIERGVGGVRAVVFSDFYVTFGASVEPCAQDDKALQDDNEIFRNTMLDAIYEVVLMDVDTMPVAVTSGFQKKNEKAVVGNGIDVYFEDGVDNVQEISIAFNPKNKQQSNTSTAPNDVYTLTVSDVLSAQEVSQKALKSDTNTQKPVTKTINGLTIVESADGGFCDTRFAEVIGKKNNYILSSLGCAHDAKTDFAAFEQVIATIKFVE